MRPGRSVPERIIAHAAPERHRGRPHHGVFGAWRNRRHRWSEAIGGARSATSSPRRQTPELVAARRTGAVPTIGCLVDQPPTGVLTPSGRRISAATPAGPGARAARGPGPRRARIPTTRTQRSSTESVARSAPCRAVSRAGRPRIHNRSTSMASQPAGRTTGRLGQPCGSTVIDVQAGKPEEAALEEPTEVREERDRRGPRRGRPPGRIPGSGGSGGP